MNPINTSIIAVALVPIGRALDAPASQTAWLVSALYLATAIGQPVAGRLVDMHGPRRLFLVSTVLVGVAGVVGALASDLPVLVVARVLLGLGTCAGYPAAMYLILAEARRTGEDSPSGVLTVLAVSSQTIAVVGPTLGGLLIDLGGWRTTFAVNVPLALAAFTVGWRRMPRQARPAVRGPVTLDLPGIAAFSVTLAALLLFLMRPAVADLWLLAVAAIAGTGFTVRELRTAAPFVDLRVLGGNLALVATYARQLLAGLTMYAVLYGVSQWLQDGRGLSPSQAGLLLFPLSGSALLASAVTGRLPWIKAKLVVGAALQVAGCALLLAVGGGTPVWCLVLLMVCFGLPTGLLTLGNQNAVYHQADAARIASSAGLLRTFMYLGAIGASAATGAFFGPRADTAGMHALAWVLLACAAALLVLTVLDRGLRRVGARPGTRSARQDPRKGAHMTLTLDPARTALLVMDYQPVLAARIPDAVAQLDRVRTALDVVRRHGGHVGYVRVGFTDEDYERVPEHSRFAARARQLGPALHADAPGTQVHSELAPLPGDVLVRKSRVGAFSTTDLHQQLQERGVDTLVLAGFSTSGVVLSTVRDAADRDYRVVVLADGCADPDPEVHTFLIDRIFPAQAAVTKVADLEPALTAGRG
ncbi:isochorismatase family protein [Dactylosporangium fulvum]|uniref:Isochorismatase family protein n=2 Tax=Dactylosporangium fulvum TaxID=53359 RepID=A0ABY5VSA0_9ACTN|nr:isochorismatase family protein [Dactylosporangium fulvum]UWP79694.1 isochorismatase family protein [Dactylosporangium fulvum]